LTTTRLSLLALSGLALLLSTAARAQEEESRVIEDGRTVSIEYTLKLDDGSTADSNVGGEALVYQQGQGQLLPALEESLVGLQADDTKSVKLSPEQGYGTRDPDALQTVPLEAIPEDARQAGAQLVSQSPEGERRIVRVHEVRETEVVLDFNHPLADQTLHFDIRILGVE
jgi:FKBP-type peptidyl-prolyl cis-trans isomerase 2